VAGAATVRILGSASVDMAGVAGGRLGVFLQANLNPWDWYPGAALVLGAGGVVDTLQQGDNLWQIAGNRLAVEETKTALQSIIPTR
jgi:fructose-1,6-bisphosphatase/inositol monophosphatase family enzyme